MRFLISHTVNESVYPHIAVKKNSCLIVMTKSDLTENEHLNEV